MLSARSRKRAHRLAAQRVADDLVAAARDFVVAGRERGALLDERVDCGFVLVDLLVDGREGLGGFLERAFALRHFGGLGRGALERAHGREVFVALRAHALRVLVEPRRQFRQQPIVAAQRLEVRDARHPAVEHARHAATNVGRRTEAARP